MNSPFHRSCAASGYTLLEMIIVVAILVTLVAMILPTMREPLTRSELTAAAKQVRAELARARLEAIESGVAQHFRFQPGQRLFEVGPKSSPGATTDRPSGGDGSELRGPAADRFAQDQEPVQYELPDGVSFYDQQSPERPTNDTESPREVDAEKWSKPIVFYPNGRTTSARIWLKGQRNFYVEVTLRGVTGVATIGQLVRPEQQP